MARRLRLGMVGGGQGAFIGAVHRLAARLDDRYELVAGALSSEPERATASAVALHIAPDRAYGDFTQMVTAERDRGDRIDAVAIVTPNHMHAAPAIAFLQAGINVICDKPLCHTMRDAAAFDQAVRESSALFALTHNYTGYPMVRQARAMVAAGELGEVRVVQVEYPQDWLATELEATGQKQAEWRTDPERSGAGGCIGDIGTHAFNLAEFVTGLHVRELAAELTTFVPGRRLDDNAHMLLRFGGGARGAMWSSQVAVGHDNGLRLRVYGAKGGLEWAQETPNTLSFAELGHPAREIRRASPAAGADAARATRLPAGHPEGYHEAFAQLYTDFADQILARAEGRKPDPACLLVPGIEAGMRGMRFIAAALASNQAGASWMKLDEL
jgi:predicted dehydrogenase